MLPLHPQSASPVTTDAAKAALDKDAVTQFGTRMQKKPGLSGIE